MCLLNSKVATREEEEEGSFVAHAYGHDSLWMKDMQDKSTMYIYRKLKHTIRDEQDLYDNTASSVTLFRARTGTLKLNWERRHTDGHTICDLCKMNLIEDIHHFLLECTAITVTRKNILGLQRPYL